MITAEQEIRRLRDALARIEDSAKSLARGRDNDLYIVTLAGIARDGLNTEQHSREPLPQTGKAWEAFVTRTLQLVDDGVLTQHTGDDLIKLCSATGDSAYKHGQRSVGAA